MQGPPDPMGMGDVGTLTWKPCTKMRTVSPTRALVGVMVIFGPLGATATKKGQGEKGRQPSAGVNEGLLNGRGCEEAEGWMLDGQTAGWPNDRASRLDRWLH